MERIKKFVRKNWFLTCLWVIVIVGVIAVITRTFHYAAEMDAKHPHYGKENPKETNWGRLTFTDQTNNGEAQPLVTELTAEGDGQFAPETEYLIRLNYPDALKAELENGRSGYEISIQYSFQVEAGGYGYLRIAIYSPETKKMYCGESSFKALDNLCLKHDIGATPSLDEQMVDEPIKFVDSNYLEFTLFTSATPDDGPKVSANNYESSLIWKIEGVDEARMLDDIFGSAEK